MKKKTKRIIALALVIMLCIGLYHGVKPTANTKNESNIALTLGDRKIFQSGSVLIYRKTFSGKPGFCLDLGKDAHSMSGMVSSNMKISDQIVRKKGNISKNLNYKFAYAMEYVGEHLGGNSVSMSDANYIGTQIYVWYVVGDLGYSEAVTMLGSHTEALNAFNKINTYVEKELKNASMIPSFSYESEDTAENDNNRISIRAGKTKEKTDKNEVLSNFEISNTKGKIIKSAKISGNTLKITADDLKGTKRGTVSLKSKSGYYRASSDAPYLIWETNANDDQSYIAYKGAVEKSANVAYVGLISTNEDVKMLSLSIEKKADVSDLGITQPPYSLDGAEFSLVRSDNNNQVLTTVTTTGYDGKRSYANLNITSVELGNHTWYLKETKAPTGYQATSKTWTIKTAKSNDETVFKIFENNGAEANEIAATVSGDDFDATIQVLETTNLAQWGTQIRKTVTDNKNIPIQGAVFQITTTNGYISFTTNRGVASTSDMTFVSGADGILIWNGDPTNYDYSLYNMVLGLGTYSIKEVSPAKGYTTVFEKGDVEFDLATDYGFSVEEDKNGNLQVSIPNDSPYFNETTNSEYVTVENYITVINVGNKLIDGNVTLTKVDGTTGKPMRVPFVIENIATGEKHVVVSDDSGFLKTEYNPNEAYNLADGLLTMDASAISDEVLQAYGGEQNIYFENASTGIRNKTKAFCSLPKGTYRITELECENTKGYDITNASTTFTIDSQNQVAQATLNDVSDFANTEIIPTLDSTASIKDKKIAAAAKNTTIKEVLSASNLVPEQNYKVVATFTCLASDDKAESVVTTLEQKFTSNKKSDANWSTMDVVFEYTFDATKYDGRSIVVTDELYIEDKNGKWILVGTHNDKSDADQTVHFGTAQTEFMGADKEINGSNPEENVVLTDVLTYSNLIPGETYTVKGTLMDKETNSPLLSKDTGEAITATKTFTPEKASGTTDILFTVKGKDILGKTIVAFEEEEGGAFIHADISDGDQTIYSPTIGTSASIILADGSEVKETDITKITSDTITIRDVVTFHKLTKGHTYRFDGTLMDQKTQKPLVDENGTSYKASVTFVAEGTTIETIKTENGKLELVSGSVNVDFTVPKNVLFDKSVVVFESVAKTNDGTETYVETEKASEEDITNREQTVTFSKLKTVATVDEEKYKDLADDLTKTIEIEDEISYTNLVPGATYRMEGVLMDTRTGKELTNENGEIYHSSVSFVAKEASGSVVVTFKVLASDVYGLTVTCFESCYNEGNVLVASHLDIDDTDQQVHFPKLHTTAKIENGKIYKGTEGEDTEVSITDKVTLSALNEGETYTLVGVLMDKDTQKPVIVDGKKVTGTNTFTYKGQDKEVVELLFNLKKAESSKYVVYEYLYIGKTPTEEKQIGTHTDINDEGQTVTIELEEKPFTFDLFPPKTGDDHRVELYMLLLAVSGIGLILYGFAFRPKKKKKKFED